ncbi:molybdopterin-guanine dinucleotide biosynthesis protein B [Paenibacillus dokdonensis]|uniref:molybdopterin-guanine dinucleotide biosynthesis protein B n=1 Tax=Paenibacillus dokdonensis TaxID=2567944 RepID=UPI0014579E75|nr:molybdopterin-guanine dinucleotide biosynthesis protein B [Paenibacillus dokdonensis]
MSAVNKAHPDQNVVGKPFVCQVVGYKNSGKTTLVCSLVERLKAMGFRVAVIKHDAHDFEIDHPGTDSYRHRAAGASAIALVSPRKTAVIREVEINLDELVESFSSYDIILVEGFKKENYPKLVMVRRTEDRELIQNLSSVLGVVTWLSQEETLAEMDQETTELPVVFGKDDIEQMTDWLQKRI